MSILFLYFIRTAIRSLLILIGIVGLLSCERTRQTSSTPPKISPKQDTPTTPTRMREDTVSLLNDRYEGVPLRKALPQDLLNLEREGILSLRKIGNSYRIESDSSITNAVWFFGDQRSENYCHLDNRYTLLILNVREAKFSYLLILDRFTKKHKIMLLQTFERCSVYQNSRHFLVAWQRERMLSGHQYADNYVVFPKKDVSQNAYCCFPVDWQPITLDQDAVYGSSGLYFKKDTLHLVAKLWDNSENVCLATAAFHDRRFVLNEEKSNPDFYTYIQSGEGAVLHDF